MKLPKAIEIIEDLRAGLDMPLMADEDKALQLGIEALQAEITWKARELEIAEARKAGIKEVVEWIQYNHAYIGLCHPDSFLDWIQIEPKKWQAQLKKWGIE